MIEKACRMSETAVPEYYVNLCARRYMEMCRTFFLAATEHERTQTKIRLTYIWDAGLIEYQRDSERRMRRYPNDFRKALIEKDGSIISR